MTASRLATLVRAAAFAAAVPLAMAAAAPAAGPEPQLRPAVEVDRDVVTLGDLFEGAGPLADRPVLPAPVPGERRLVSLRQAFELAGEHGLGWRPVAPFDHVVVTRAWRTLDPVEVERALARALSRLGAGDNLHIDLPPAQAKVAVARGAIARLDIEGATYDADSGRFHATLVVDDGTGRARRHRLIGRAWSTVALPVLTARLRRDDVIAAGDVALKTFRADRVPDDALHAAEDLIGLSPTRTIPPGKPVRNRDVGAPVIVEKGALVTMNLITVRMQLVATGRAQASGALGDTIGVRNTQSKLVVEAIVTGPDRVSVRPAALHLTAPHG